MPSATTTLTGLQIEGNLIASDLMADVLAGELKGQTPDAFGLPKTDKLADEIALAWGDAKIYWAAYQRALSRLPEDDPATTVTREQWVMPLLRSLGYSPVYVAKAEVVEGQTYAISHRAEPGDNKSPVHVVGSGVRLEQRPPSGTPRLSAHALVQEYLNRTEHLWAVVTNGLRWRLLRDSSLMTRLTYVEFDLEQILSGENFAEFGLFYRLFHRSRLPEGMDDADECLLEFYHQESLQQGGRVRDRLRDGVEQALRVLGTGFLQHPDNQAFRERLAAGELTETDYYRQLLLLIYRLLFLMVAESRHLLLSGEDIEKARVYREYYSIERLRALAEKPSWRREGFQDLWQGLRVTFRLFDENWRGQVLGLSPLNGDLFGSHSLLEIDGCAIDNHDLTLAIRHLSLYEQRGQLRRVNYGALDVEELGSVYESLLDFHPQVAQRQGIYEFQLVTGSDRKTTGSYYTPPELVGQLIKSALEPVIADRLEALGKDATPEAQEQVLLSLKICDPACGSGHFLLAAARRVGKELARIRTGEPQPGPESLRVAIRDVIQHCVYGVDLNPLAVDLCKVALWLEGLCRGLSLNFLDHRIKCGNSLVGVLDLDCLKEGIPDNAYKAVTGDDKKLATQLKKRNKQERKDVETGQGSLPLFNTFERDREEYARAWREIESMKDDDPTAVRQKQQRYERSRHLVSWLRDRSACNLWTAAFFMPLTEQHVQLLPTSGVLDNLLKGNWATQEIVNAADRLAEEKRFFHWPLEFPEVSKQGGFDCVLGNPPWEKINLKDEEFFAVSHPEIANAPTKAKRKKLIETLESLDPDSYKRYQEAQKMHDALSNFFRESGSFPLTGVSRINLYSIFAELGVKNICDNGRLGFVIASGLVTDDNNKKLFEYLIDNDCLVQVLDFENRGGIFPGVHKSYKFCLFCAGGAEINQASCDFAFYLTKISDINDQSRHFTLSSEELFLINPNTKTCPTFKNKTEAELLKKIYKRIKAWCLHKTLKDWPGKPRTPFNVSNDSNLFLNKEELLERNGDLQEFGKFSTESEIYLPVYESKFIHQFEHRYSTFKNVSSESIETGNSRESEKFELEDLRYTIEPRFWLAEKKQKERYPGNWFIAYRMIVRATDERSSIAAIIPARPCSNSLTIIDQISCINALLMCSNMNTLVYDYVARQKIPGTNFNHWIWKQLPLVSPSNLSQTDIDFIAPRVLELTYTAWDLQPFAQDMGYEGEPFIWDPERRALLRAELDAYYAHLYGLTRDELRYILDPADIHGPDFPSETFRVLKNNEIKQFGEYRTQRLVLEAWDRLGF
ncbi:Eco57I restriction-modification methylase domain-containing protein [Halomicronema sp. CCY15110]|uniref:Eco57I restriction-modification methylase domain-containing protein n=1 Tax=Halomicronema sp. CCY15110 TaxID=2767773 RepID=UPI001951727F|nr:N-6 DNA methylase [Halomicronema sp. CCY15110]